MSTGYFGIPGDSGARSTKVHYVFDTRYSKPICGSRIGPLMHFQWCAGGFEERFVECERCRRIGATAPLIKIQKRASSVTRRWGSE